MRHIFDQYNQPENRLTHALISCLAQDEKLLRRFIKLVTGQTTPFREKIYLEEQCIPGQEESDEDEAERKGMPDAWIYMESGRALLIESKVSQKLTIGQLKGHMATAKRQGFTYPQLLIIHTDPKKVRFRLQNNMSIISWSELYEWTTKQSQISEWAGQFKSYLEIAEAKMVQNEYLKEGKLTRFSGIPFSSANPYNYIEAKRILRLLIDALKSNKAFVKKMGASPFLPGRGAITGRTSSAVWDLIRLKGSKKDKTFTGYPHLTFAIASESANFSVTIPNGVRPKIRKRFLGGTYEEFEKLILSLLTSLRAVLELDKTAKPLIKVHQRHFPSQRSDGIHDAVLFCDLRTAKKNEKKTPEKYQPEWLKVIYEVMMNRKSNLQLMIGVDISYKCSKVIQTPKALRLIENIFIGLLPILNQYRKAQSKVYL